MAVLSSCHRRQHRPNRPIRPIRPDTTQSSVNVYLYSKNSTLMSKMETNSIEVNPKLVKQTLFDETNITVYQVKRHSRSRGRARHKSHYHRVHPRRSLSQGATPRSRHPLLIRQPLAPQRRLSVSNLKLNNNYSGYQKSSLICLSIVSFTSMLAMSLIAPFFPLEASMKGMRETVYGFVFSVYALVIMIVSPISGKLVPIVGAKFMLISGVFVAGVANILFGLLDKIDDLATFTAYCFIVRIFEAIGAAAFSVASYTIIMQVFPDNIGTAFGFIETCVGLGLSLGPAIGGGLYGIGGYGLPFFVLGTIMLINIPLCLYVIKPVESIIPIKKDSNDTYMKLLSIPQVLVVGIVVVLVSQTISFLDPTVEPHFRQMNISPEYVSIVFLLLSATYTVSSPIVGWFSGYFDNKFPIMALGMFLASNALLLLGPSFLIPLESSLLLSVGSMALIGIAYAIAFIPTFESILDIAIDNGFSESISTYSLVSGLWSSMYSLGEVTGPSLGGWLSETFDFSITSTIMAAFALIGAITAGITCFFVQSDDSESSSSSSLSDTDCERSLSNKSARNSRRGSQWDQMDEQLLEKQPLLESTNTQTENSYLMNNNAIFKDKENELIFSVASI